MALKIICGLGLFGVLVRAIPFWISWTFSCEYDRPSDRKKDKILVHKSIKVRLQIYQKQNTLIVYQLLYTYNITSKYWCESSISRFPNIDVSSISRFPKKTYQPVFLHQPIRRFTNHPNPPSNPHKTVGVAIEVGSGTLPDPPPERWDWTPFQLAEMHGAYKWGSLKTPTNRRVLFRWVFFVEK